MKVVVHYILLLIFIVLLSWFLVQNDATAMGMGQMLSVSLLLGLYVVAMSLVGEGKPVDEREAQHRYFSNRTALLGGSIVLSLGVLYQLFTYQLDYWLLAGLAAINLVKIISLVYLTHKN